MWNNAWPFNRRYTWAKKKNVYTRDDREISWGSGMGRIGYLNYRAGDRKLAVFFELGSWSHDIKLRPIEGPWQREDGSTEPVTFHDNQTIVTDITEALTERGYKIAP